MPPPIPRRPSTVFYSPSAGTRLRLALIVDLFAGLLSARLTSRTENVDRRAEQPQNLGHSFSSSIRHRWAAIMAAERMNDFVAILHSTRPPTRLRRCSCRGKSNSQHGAPAKDGIRIETELLALLEAHAARA